MLFHTYLFLFVFLPVTWLVYWYIAPAGKPRRAWLLAASLVFYGYASVGYLALLLVMLLITFLTVRYLIASDNPRRRAWGLVLGFTPLVTLAFYKFASFLAEPANALIGVAGPADAIPALDIALPLGISFYTFNLLGYSLDVYRRRTEAATSVIAFASAITFFPIITSGPLVRHREFSATSQSALAQHRPTASQIELGLFRLALGLAKKVVIADQIAVAINPLLEHYGELGLIGAWAAVLGYTFQLYFDFSGYTDMAMGVAHLLGIELPPNFNAPYAARNITEFWQRWHITLSQWFRDYLFFPLSRSLIRRDQGRHLDRVRAISLLVTMTLVGLWHGAAWTFVLWGAYHGALLAIHAQSRTWRWLRLPVPVARAITFGAVVFGWALFRSTSLEMTGSLVTSMIGLNGIGTAQLAALGIGKRFYLVVPVLLALSQFDRDAWNLSPRRGWVYAGSLALLVTLALLMMGEPRTFLYVQF
jgi:alginate O-acetyltransferase complex protein AlgI